MEKKRFILKKCKLYDVKYNTEVPIATFRNVDDAEVICSWLNELYNENEQLRQELQEKQEEEKLYANEILELREANKEFMQFKELGGDY